MTTTDLPDNLDFNILFQHRITINPDVEKRHEVYNEGELGIINGFKDLYLSANSAGLRKQIAQVQMFPALFNYWKKIGEIYKNHEITIKSNVRAYMLCFLRKLMYICTGILNLDTKHMENWKGFCEVKNKNLYSGNRTLVSPPR
jgi:hypothetical protein